jgi:uncharacterized membrane protein (DUF2068 family)
MRGHSTPAADAVSIGPADAALGAQLADGRRLARCLRCDTWVEHPEPDPSTARWASLPPLADLALPRRGKPLHEAILMRLIAINKGVHAAVFTVLAVTLMLLETNLDRLHRWAGSVVDALSRPVGDTGQGASQGWLGRQLQHLFDLKPDTLRVLLGLAVTYAVVEWTEAVGLWKEKRWAEYLTVLATAGFLPLEIHELVNRVTIVRVGALIVNVALIVWLVWAKHLFGLRGGSASLHAAGEIDWEAVLVAPSPAAGRTSGEPRRTLIGAWSRSSDANS